jgi:hypothetical protein
MRGMAALLLVALLTLPGCALVAVGAVAGAAAGTTYTVLGVASKTFTDEYDAVLAALKQALVTLDIKTGDERKTEDGGKVVTTEIDAFARDLAIAISIERITDKATRVVVDASRKYVVKDSATATEIINQTATNLAKKS